MRVQQLYDILGNFPPESEIMVAETGSEYFTEIKEVKELTSPIFDSNGDFIGEKGEGDIIIVVN